MPTNTARKELKVIEKTLDLMTDSDAEYIDKSERTAALYAKLKHDLDANGFLSPNLETNLRFRFDISYCYISRGADNIVILI